MQKSFEKALIYQKESKNGQKYRGPKILLVDDDDYNIKALKIILKYHIKLNVDLICDEAVNGMEALAAVKNNVVLNDSKKC